MSSEFHYSPLEAGQFRLLTITAVERDIVCELDSFAVDDAPPYDAISYAWGPKEAPVDIICNARRMRISPRLASMLRHLHLYRPSPKSYRIWVDALCIDQTNETEKEKQLPCMRSIYSKAQRVIIWLGEHQNASEMVIQSIPDLTRKLEGLEHIKYLDNKSISNVLMEHGLQRLDHEVWSAIPHLYCRPWFTRLWVVQEAALSRELIVMCGNSWLSWKPFCAFTWAYDKTCLHIRIAQLDIRMQVNESLYATKWKDSLKPQVINEGENGGMLLLLARARYLNCTVESDRIYGLLGLILPKLQDQIESLNLINYAKPYWRTYIDFAKWSLQIDMTLTLFGDAVSNGKHPCIPSWCPDWNTKPNPISLARSSSIAPGFGGSASKRPPVRAIEGTDQIIVRGFRVDEVLRVVESQYPDEMIRSDVGFDEAVLRFEAECLNLSQNAYKCTPDTLPEEHWRTLVANEVKKFSRSGDMIAGYKSMKSSLSDPGDSERVWTEAGIRYAQVMDDACQGRSYFSTKGGRIGIGPKGLECNDAICVFYGGGPVFILRFDQGKETAQLIGEAYVHGLMSGEALTMEGRGEDENFILR